MQKALFRLIGRHLQMNLLWIELDKGFSLQKKQKGSSLESALEERDAFSSSNCLTRKMKLR